MKKKSQFFVISAPSGTGKTTLVRKILQEVPGCLRSVSVTTRPPRPGEVEGVDYLFVNERTFRERVEQGEFFEWEEVHGHCYGTPRAGLEGAGRSGKDLLLDIDTRGAVSVKRAYPASCLIFLKPPNQEVLEQRLRSRQTEQERSLRQRLEAARREMAEQEKFDYVIINDDLEQAFQEVKGIIELRRKKKD